MIGGFRRPPRFRFSSGSATLQRIITTFVVSSQRPSVPVNTRILLPVGSRKRGTQGKIGFAGQEDAEEGRTWLQCLASRVPPGAAAIRRLPGRTAGQHHPAQANKARLLPPFGDGRGIHQLQLARVVGRELECPQAIRSGLSGQHRSSRTDRHEKRASLQPSWRRAPSLLLPASRALPDCRWRQGTGPIVD